MQGEKNSRKGKQRNMFRKNIIGFLKIKTIKMRKEKKMEERKKENSTELQRPNAEAEVYNKNKKCD